MFRTVLEKNTCNNQHIYTVVRTPRICTFTFSVVLSIIILLQLLTNNMLHKIIYYHDSCILQ